MNINKTFERLLLFSSLLTILACPIASVAQTCLPIVGHDISISPSSMELQFTQAGQKQLLSETELDMSVYTSFDIIFGEPVEVDGLSIETGSDKLLIPKGACSFHGSFTSSNYAQSWTASTGEQFSYRFSLLFLKAEEPAIVHILKIVVKKKDGTEVVCYGDTPTDGWGYWSKIISSKAKNGETFEDSYETEWESPVINKTTSGKVIIGSNGFLGGAEWASDALNETTVYRIIFDAPVESNYWAWKYITKSGEQGFQSIESGSLSSELIIEDAVNECCIVNTESALEDGDRILNVKSITIQNNYPTSLGLIKDSPTLMNNSYDLSGRINKDKILRRGIHVFKGKKVFISSSTLYR